MSASQPPGSAPACAKCGERPGIVAWGDVMAVTHGLTVMVCKTCALTAQLAYARKAARRIPALERQLATAKARNV